MSPGSREIWEYYHPDEAMREACLEAIVILAIVCLFTFIVAQKQWNEGRKIKATISNGISATALLLMATFAMVLSASHFAIFFLTLGLATAVMTFKKYLSHIADERKKLDEKWKQGGKI